MIITRAPFRISFVGGGTDLQAFYSQYPGRVISSTIDKYIYVAINQGVLLDGFTIKYLQTEQVLHPKELSHDRFREALIRMNIVRGGLEIASFANLPSNTGLGSSSSFSVALLKALHVHLGTQISRAELAELACELEIDILKEPIGKQDQYAAAFGGFNVFQFNPDGSVDVSPVYLDYKVRAGLEDHTLLFFTGITRAASSVLSEQKTSVRDKFETYKQMSDSVPVFTTMLQDGDYQGMANMLHEGWLRKKSLASSISNTTIDGLYDAGISAGAWGGKILGAGGGGCLFFIAPPETHQRIKESLRTKAAELSLENFKQIEFDFSQSGSDVLFNSNFHHA
jgi:D-glycero-alpha-D-manno-heptose-7-phosphate kinase